jgi:hypothetical protein
MLATIGNLLLPPHARQVFPIAKSCKDKIRRRSFQPAQTEPRGCRSLKRSGSSGPALNATAIRRAAEIGLIARRRNGRRSRSAVTDGFCLFDANGDCVAGDGYSVSPDEVIPFCERVPSQQTDRYPGRLTPPARETPGLSGRPPGHQPARQDPRWHAVTTLIPSPWAP